MSVTLLPCPFCGDGAEVEREGTARQSCIIVCTNCGTRVESNERGTGSAWNNRVAPPALTIVQAPSLGTWCPQCGDSAHIDEDGCCAGCGATATGDGADQAVAALAEAARLRAELADAKALADGALDAQASAETRVFALRNERDALLHRVGKLEETRDFLRAELRATDARLAELRAKEGT